MGALAETIVNYIFELEEITPSASDTTQANRLKTLLRGGYMTKEISDIFHVVRINRNEAVHAGYDSFEECMTLLEITHTLSVWFMQGYGNCEGYEPSPFVLPDDIRNQPGYQKLLAKNEQLAGDLVKMQAWALSKLVYRRGRGHEPEHKRHTERAESNLRTSMRRVKSRALLEQMMRRAARHYPEIDGDSRFGIRGTADGQKQCANESEIVFRLEKAANQIVKASERVDRADEKTISELGAIVEKISLTKKDITERAAYSAGSETNTPDGEI